MPTPITFEITMADASSGPSRRSSETAGKGVTRPSLRDERAGNGILPDAFPLRRSVLREELHIGVHEVAVAQHFLARLVAARVASRRPDAERRRHGPGGQTMGACSREKPAAPFVFLRDAPEQRV